MTTHTIDRNIVWAQNFCSPFCRSVCLSPGTSCIRRMKMNIKILFIVWATRAYDDDVRETITAAIT